MSLCRNSRGGMCGLMMPSAVNRSQELTWRSSEAGLEGRGDGAKMMKRLGKGRNKGEVSIKWQPTPAFLLGESHGQRSLVGYSPWGHKELDMTD